jgi:hypothetical protein
VKLAEVLSPRSKPAADEPNVMFLTGVLRPDTDEKYFRLYPAPNDQRSYLLIPQESVKEEVSELTDLEMAHAGFLGEKAHRVAISIGTPVFSVNITPMRIGEEKTRTWCSSGPCPLGESITSCSGNTRCVSGCNAYGRPFACCLYPGQPNSICSGR